MTSWRRHRKLLTQQEEFKVNVNLVCVLKRSHQKKVKLEKKNVIEFDPKPSDLQDQGNAGQWSLHVCD